MIVFFLCYKSKKWSYSIRGRSLRKKEEGGDKSRENLYHDYNDIPPLDPVVEVVIYYPYEKMKTLLTES